MTRPRWCEICVGGMLATEDLTFNVGAIGDHSGENITLAICFFCHEAIGELDFETLGEVSTLARSRRQRTRAA